MKWLLIMLLLLAGLCGNAQKPYLYFNRITTQNGLSHNKVNAIIQDKRGFIWIGTDDGLNRYDGSYFTIFRNIPGDFTTISGNIITDLLEDKDGIIWIATSDGGLSRYDYRLPAPKQFKQYKHIVGDTTSIPVNIINALTEDTYGYLWLATSDHYVLRFDRKTETFLTPVAEGTKTSMTLFLDKASNMLWVGKQGGGILKINTRDLTYTADKRYDNLYANLPHAAVTALYGDGSGNMWIGSWDNVLYQNKIKTDTETVFKQSDAAGSFPNDDVLAFEADKSGRLWMGGRYFGLTIYDSRQQKFYNYRYDASREGTIADDQVNCIFQDNRGRMWLGTRKGVSVYNPQQQPFVQTFLPEEGKDIHIYDFFKAPDGRLWLGTSEGIYMRSNDSATFEHRKIMYKNQSLAVSKFFMYNGAWYIGTNYSFFVYDPEKNEISLLPNTEKDTVMKRIIESRIVSVIADSIDAHPALLVSPYGHYLAYYDFAAQKWVSRKDSVKQIITRFNLKDNLIRKLYKTTDGTLWLATAKYGLGYWPGTAQRIDHLCNNPANTASISNDNVYDLTEDKKGNLWVSTYGGGLNYYNVAQKKFLHIPSTNNLSEGIQLDARGNVWGISNGNIYKYDPAIKTNSSFILPDLEKSGGVKGYIYKDASGMLYTAGTNYFIEFNPLKVSEESSQHAVYFTDFKIFNNSSPELLLQQSIELKYFQNYFTIEFSAPQFSATPVEYAYRLEGLEKDWNETGGRNFANYSNLPGGDYTFKVMATNKKGNWGTEVASLKITIIPPFWKQWWFYLLCALLVAGIIYFVYRYRINELLKRQAIRNKIAQDLHDSMGSTLSSISVYSQVAKIYHQQNKETELEHTLEKIGATSGEMISEMSDIVWAINPKNDTLNTIIQRMESFAKPLLQAKNIAFSFNYTINTPELDMQMDKRKNFYLIFKEAINNALKYSGCKHLTIDIKQQSHTIELVIKDDGDGFDPDKVDTATSRSLSGNGLKNMKLRSIEMDGILTLHSKPGKGTTLRLVFSIP